MLVIHGDLGVRRAAGLGGGLRRCPRRPRRAPGGRRGRRARTRSPPRRTGWRTRSRPPWPTSARRGHGSLPRKAVDDEITLRLPSTADGPLASPELVRPPGRRRRDRHGPAGCRWPAGGSPCSSSSPRPPRRCWRRSPGCRRATSWPAARSATWPRSPGSPTTWRPAAGCCPCSPRKTAVTPPAGGRCCPPPTPGTPASSPPRCRRRLPRPLADGAGPDGGLGGAPGPLLADMLDALADASVRTRLPVALLPARRGRRPARIACAERMRACPDRPAACCSRWRTRPTSARRRTWRPRSRTGWRAPRSRRLGPHLLPPGRAARRRAAARAGDAAGASDPGGTPSRRRDAAPRPPDAAVPTPGGSSSRSSRPTTPA